MKYYFSDFNSYDLSDIPIAAELKLALFNLGLKF